MTDTQAQAKQSNEDRKRDALIKKAEKAHNWRVQVWAQSERRIQAINAELEVLGVSDRFEPWEPNFEDAEMLKHYAEMPLS